MSKLKIKKKYVYGLTIVLILLILTIFFIPKHKLTEVNRILENNMLMVDESGTLPKEFCSNFLKNNVIVIYRTGCPACAVALPRIKEIEKELNKTFEYINVGTAVGINRTMEIKVIPRYVPTVIAYCDIYIGVLEKERYKEIFSKR